VTIVSNSKQRLALYYKQITIAISIASLVFIIFTLIVYYLQTTNPELHVWWHNSSVVMCGLYLFVVLLLSRFFYIGLIKEATFSEESENALWESEEMQKAIIQASPAGVVTLNEKGIITSWNPAAESILGWSSKEILGKSIDEVMLMMGMDKNNLLFPDKDRSIDGAHKIFPTKNGGSVDINLYSVPFQDVSGNTKGVLFLFTDITKQLRAEEARYLAEVAKQREQSLGRFLQIAVHELRNPVTGLKGIVSLINSHNGQSVPPAEFSQALSMLQREVDRMAALLNDVMYAFKAREGQLPISKSPINLCEVVNKSTASFSLNSKGISIYTQMPDGPITIYGDPVRLTEVLNNVISNAVKYSPVGSSIQVEVLLNKKKNRAKVLVKDSGIGIPENQLENIFEGFYRGSNLKESDPGGMGLGLYICKQIIDNHGGCIWAKNNQNGQPGSTFGVEIPVYDAEQ
jgi:PAS domain S-box-containing protein